MVIWKHQAFTIAFFKPGKIIKNKKIQVLMHIQRQFLLRNIIKLYVMRVFDLYSVLKISLIPLLTLLIASVKCKQGFNRLFYCKVFFKVVCTCASQFILNLFIILEFNVYLSLIRLECVWCLNCSGWSFA